MKKFKIEKIEYLESEIAFFKVINRVHWRVEIEENGIILETFGILHLDLPKDNFIEFEKVTNEIIYDWIKDDKKFQNAIEQTLNEIEVLKNSNQKEVIPEFEEIIIN